MSGSGVGVCERVGVGVGTGSTGVSEAIRVGKVTGISSVPSVDSEAQPKRVTQSMGKSARISQRFIEENQTCRRLGLLLSHSSYKSLLFFSSGNFSLDAGITQPL